MISKPNPVQCLKHYLNREFKYFKLPRISNSVGKLLLLSPQDVFRQVRFIRIVESLSDAKLFDGFAVSEADHLHRRVKGHGILQKLAVEERDSSLDTPGQHTLVGTQAIILVKIFNLMNKNRNTYNEKNIKRTV